MMLSMRRWWCIRFRTKVRHATFNQYGDRVMYTHEWDALGGWATALVPGYEVSRPDWWRRGSTSSVTGRTTEAARARLDEWQREQAEMRAVGGNVTPLRRAQASLKARTDARR